MAKQLKNYKRREIKALIIEDFESGKIFKLTNDYEIEKALVKYSENEVTKVFNPTSEQKNKIYELMDISNEGDNIVSKVDGIDLLIKIIPMLTDIEIDLTIDEDIELINDIINDPNDVFEMVAKELNGIIMKLNLDWIDNLKLLNELPDDIINALANSKVE